MILQALYDYYQRKAADPESGIAPEGWEWKPIPFLVAIDQDGKYLHIRDTREIDGKKKVSKSFLVPRAVGKFGKDACDLANLFWDHYGYVLQIPKEDTDKAREMSFKQFDAFLGRLKALPDDVRVLPVVRALLKFYELEEFRKLSAEDRNNCLKVAGGNLTFFVEPFGLVVENSDVKAYVDGLVKLSGNAVVDDDDEGRIYNAVCLITGQKGIVQRKHARTSINKDTKSLVAIQKGAGYDSYGKQQAFNCPVGLSAEFAYTTALNALLKNGGNRLQLSDTTVVFWTQKKTGGFDLEAGFPWFFKSEKDNPDKNVEAVRSLYQAVETGRLPLDEEDRFYVLGLAPNAARISVRFWKTGKVSDFAGRIRQHFEDFNIVHGPKEPEYLSLYQILSSTVLDYKMDNVPPNLAGSVVASILDGVPYPRTLLQQCIRRIRAEQKVGRPRAAILKASINRFNRLYNKASKEVCVGLDRTNTDTGYRMGRLFAVLEKIQEESGTSASIRERFYGAASSTPVTVFSRLLKLNNYYLVKLSPGRKIQMEKEIQDIVDALKVFPSHLTLDQQAMFAVGYYHQRQDFFTKKDA